MNNIQLTEHFKLEEFTRSDTASILHIDNTPSKEIVFNLKALCENVLEPLRQWFGKPITISSGYRCPALNKVVKGYKYSQHLTGQAADLHMPSMEIGNLWITYLLEYGHFDQLIKEHDSHDHTWIHVSYWEGHNRQTYIPNLKKKE